MAERTKKVLIIEDEPDMVRGLRDALQFEGFVVESAQTGTDGLDKARSAKPDLILLDLMLPDINGHRVCEELRRFDQKVPVIMLTARSQEADKIRGLDVGADDYVTKPFSVGELLARIKAIFRRLDRVIEPQTDVIRLSATVEVNSRAHTMIVNNQLVPLGFYEVELLKLLYERANEPVSRDEMLEKIWGLNAHPTNRTVDNFVVKLRRKLEDDPKNPQKILTVYGYGYKLVVND